MFHERFGTAKTALNTFGRRRYDETGSGEEKEEPSSKQPRKESVEDLKNGLNIAVIDENL